MHPRNTDFPFSFDKTGFASVSRALNLSLRLITGRRRP
jgi:hypothetical protein